MAAYICDPEVDALGVAAWLEGCSIAYLKTDVLNAPTQHHSWSLHFDWATCESVSYRRALMEFSVFRLCS
jgi:hypothetical protein